MIRATSFFTLLILTAAACRDADAPAPPDGCAPVDPDTYRSDRYTSNAIIELGLRQTYDAFMEPMRGAGLDVAVKPSVAQLRALYEAGPPSLKSITTPTFAAKVEEWLALFEAAAGQTWTPAEPPPATGGKYPASGAGDIFTREGLDLRQAIDKGLFAAGFYFRAVTLMNGPVTAATIDRVVALFGSHPSFGSTDAGAPLVDIWTAAYARRRTNPNAARPGIYARLKTSFVAAQAAAAGGEACAGELQVALGRIREDWEQAMLATTLYYAADAKSKLAQLAFGPALHSIGEGVGFPYGFRMMPAGARKITDAQIDEILALFGVPAAGPATTYRFATDTAAEAAKLDEVVTRLQAAYGWSDAEVESFRTSY